MKEKARKLIKHTLIGNAQVQALNYLKQKQQESKQQYETSMVIEKKKPTNQEGKAGDRKIIQEGNNYYLYVKVTDRWMKIQLEEVN